MIVLMAGVNDGFATKRKRVSIQSVCPQAEIMIVEGCGHRPHMPMEKAIEVNNRIFDFLGRAKEG